jgi:hypothetical protein
VVVPVADPALQEAGDGEVGVEPSHHLQTSWVEGVVVVGQGLLPQDSSQPVLTVVAAVVQSC